MKIKSVRARVFEWKGKTVPPQGNFCSNAMDLVYSNTESMSTFRFHSWTVVEIETDDGIIGLGNVALAPKVAKADRRVKVMSRASQQAKKPDALSSDRVRPSLVDGRHAL